MQTRILFAYDETAPTQRAFDYILRLASMHRSELVILAVIKPSALAADYATQKLLENAMRELSGRMARLRRRAEFAGTPSTLVLRVGRPVELVVQMAMEWHADLIVIGERNRPIIPRWLLPQVSSQVRARAPCPVIVVP